MGESQAMALPVLRKEIKARFQTGLFMVMTLMPVLTQGTELPHDFDPAVLVQTVRGKINFICSGALITPTLVITTAHCIEKADRVLVTTAQKLEGSSPMVEALTWKMHPTYSGNNFNGVDLGVIHLKSPVQLKHYFNPEVMAYAQLKKQDFYRVGYGIRNQINQKQLFIEKGEKTEIQDHYLQTYDENALLGDSGGPVLVKQGSQFILIGIHSGRKQDPSGKLENYSNTLVWNPEIIQWMKKN